MNETTAPALVADEPIETTTTASEDDAYGAAFDKISAESPIDDEPEEVSEAEPKAEAAEDETTEDVSEDEKEAKPKAPTDLPGGIKAAWDSFSKEVQDSIVATQRDMAQKLSDQGRLVQGLSPIKDALVTAAKDIPHLASLRPDQVAQEIFQLAKISQDFNTKPVETLVGLAKKHGMEQALREALAGGEVSGEARTSVELQKQIASLQQQLAQAINPDYIRQQVSMVTQEERATSEVQNFANTAEHWAEVEPFLPTYIPIVQAEMGDGASAKDILAASYELAVQRRLPGAKAKPQEAADEAAQVVDPKRTEAAIKAKSVNVSGTVNGKGKVLTEDQAYSQAFDRIARQ